MAPSSAGTRQVLLVLGMHRSGTSATAGFLVQLGAAMAATPIRGDANNPRGYWEPEPLNSLHNRLLVEAGSGWDDWGLLDAGRLAAAGGGAAATLAAAFEAEFGDAALAVLKDPRICRFVPLWREVLAGLGVAPKVVMPLRHPLEVAGSLARRDGMSEAAALLLWLRHMLEAEAGTRDLPRSFLVYDALLEDWRGAADRLAAELDLAWPVPPEEAAEAIEAFLARDMRHHAAEPEAALPPWAAEGWAAFRALAAGEAGAARRLDALRAALDAGDALMGAEVRRLAAAAAAADRARTAAEAGAAEAVQTAGTAQAEAERARRAAEAATASARTELGRLRGLLTELGARNDALAGRNAALEAARAAREAERDARTAERDALAAERDALRASRSWRMTKPFRRAAAALRRPATAERAAPE